MEIEISNQLNRIDSLILKKGELESNGLFAGLGGCSMYFSKRYLQTKNKQYHAYSIEFLEQIVENANHLFIPNHLCLTIPCVTPCWLIDQYVKLGLLDNDEKKNSRMIVDLILESLTDEELKNNHHDLFYGFIGKAIFLIENDQKNNAQCLSKIVEALKENAIVDKCGVYWNTPYPFHPLSQFEKTINFGIPHGCLGIILFLIKCSDSLKMRNELSSILRSSIDWILNKLDEQKNKLLHVYGNEGGGMGRLAWCYGDLAISFVLLRYDEVFGSIKSREKAYELIALASSKSINETGLQYYSEYDFYDVGLCHGTSSVAYMYHKMAQITGDNNIKILADKWLSITVENLTKFLFHFDIVADRRDKDIDYTMGFLEGLSGVGLALISFLNPKLSDWDKLLLLDRPGRE